MRNGPAPISRKPKPTPAPPPAPRNVDALTGLPWPEGQWFDVSTHDKPNSWMWCNLPEPSDITTLRVYGGVCTLGSPPSAIEPSHVMFGKCDCLGCRNADDDIPWNGKPFLLPVRKRNRFRPWILAAILASLGAAKCFALPNNPIDAIRAGAPVTRLTVGTYTLSETLRIPSFTTIICDPGAEIVAAPGAFKGVHDSLILINGSNVTILNCVFRMRKADYTLANGYPESEWRSVITLAGAKNITLINVTADSGGGDGACLESRLDPWTPCENVVFSHCAFKNNYRNAVSVTSARKTLFEDCTFAGTVGTAPQAGLDLENEDGEPLEVTLRRCNSDGNRVSAYMINLTKSKPDTSTIKIEFDDCKWSNVPANQTPIRLIGVFAENGYLAPNLAPKSTIKLDFAEWVKPVE